MTILKQKGWSLSRWFRGQLLVSGFRYTLKKLTAGTLKCHLFEKENKTIFQTFMTWVSSTASKDARWMTSCQVSWGRGKCWTARPKCRWFRWMGSWGPGGSSASMVSCVLYYHLLPLEDHTWWICPWFSRFRPLRIWLWDPFQVAELHG